MDKKKTMPSVFTRLYLLLLGTLLLAYIIIIGIFIRYVQMEHQRELQTAELRLENGVYDLNKTMLNAEETVKSLAVNVDLNKMAYHGWEDQYDRSQTMSRLLSLIRSLESANEAVESIDILFPSENLGIGTEQVHGYYYADKSKTEMQEGTRTDGILELSDGKLYFRMGYPIKNSLDPNFVPDYMIQMELSEAYMEHFLQALCLNEGQMAALYFTGTDATRVVGDDGDWDQSCISAELTDYSLAVYYDAGREFWNSSIRQTLLIMIIVLVLCAVLASQVIWTANRRLQKPLKVLSDAFHEVEKGNLDCEIHHKQNDLFFFMYEAFNRMISRIARQIADNEEQAKLLQDAELIQLQSQINPHFLYNSFYLLRIMAKNEDYDLIQTFVTSLAKYYRFLNKEVDKTVELQKEADHMISYTDIQQVRFGDKISIEIQDVPDELLAMRVPKLILQPIVENAYNYGVRNKLKGGSIRIRYRVEGSYLYILVDDNGEEVNPEKIDVINQKIRHSEGSDSAHALSNINRRLQLAYGTDCGVVCSIGEMGGMETKLILRTDILLK